MSKQDKQIPYIQTVTYTIQNCSHGNPPLHINNLEGMDGYLKITDVSYGKCGCAIQIKTFDISKQTFVEGDNKDV